MFNHPGILGYCLLLFLALNNADIPVRVNVGSTFRLLAENSLDNPINCTLIHLWIETPIFPPPVIDDENDTQTGDQRIVPLGNNLCGARIHNATLRDNGVWTLTLSNETSSVSESFRVTPLAAQESVNRTSTAVVGTVSVPILCGPQSMLYCEIRDPLGNIAVLSTTARCSTVIPVVKPTDFGVWTCTVGVSGSMEEIHATHTLNMGEPLEEVVISANDTSFGKLITWQVRRISVIASWCRAFPPNGKSILVAAGLELDKYISVGTDLSQRKCGLLVKGEFPKEYEGLWRLEIGVNNIRTIGGFIEMPEGKIPGPNDRNSAAQDSKKMDIRVAAGESFIITCQTQYSAGYCWIQGPQGQIENSADELNVGRCSYTINNANSTAHTGIWTCNMAHVNGGKEDHLETEVTVMDKLYNAVELESTARRGTKTVIACESVLNYPLEYCRFVRPDGVGLGVTPGMEPFGRYSYAGPGLDHGYCGLAISSVEMVDDGEWTCVSRLRLRTLQPENTDKFFLAVFETSIASVVGMVIGLIITAAVVAATVIVVYRRKRSRTDDTTVMVQYN